MLWLPHSLRRENRRNLPRWRCDCWLVEYCKSILCWSRRARKRMDDSACNWRRSVRAKLKRAMDLGGRWTLTPTLEPLVHFHPISLFSPSLLLFLLLLFSTSSCSALTVVFSTRALLSIGDLSSYVLRIPTFIYLCSCSNSHSFSAPSASSVFTQTSSKIALFRNTTAASQPFVSSPHVLDDSFDKASV